MQVKKHEVKLQDSWMGFGSREFEYHSLEKDYYYTRKQNQKFGIKKPQYFSMFFLQDEEFSVIKRQVTTFASVLADIGGFFEVITVITALIAGSIQGFLFKSTIIAQVFYEEKRGKENYNNK